MTMFHNQNMMKLLWRQGCFKMMSTTSVPVITVPAKLKQYFRKIEEKQKLKELKDQRLKSMQGHKKIPIISCKRKEFNHYKGQLYDKFEPLPLASKGWHHYKAAGDYFTILSYGGNPAFTQVFKHDEAIDFTSFDFHENIIDALNSSQIKQPTNVQMLAIPPLLEGKNVLCAAETGTGKTLAYLLPVIELIIRSRSNSSKESVNTPSGLVIVPSRELADQIGVVAKSFADYIPFQSKVLVGGSKMKESVDSYISEVDLVIATLGTLKRQVDAKIYDLSQVRHLILDEADTLLDDSFNKSLIEFISRFRLSHVPGDMGVQLALFGATMPRDITNILGDFISLDSLHKVTTTHLHRLMPHVPQKFLRVKSSEKSEKLLELVKADFQNKRPVMIFSKDRKTCDYVSIFLEQNGIPNVALNGEMPSKLRQGKFELFQSGKVNVISCTDIGSRGLDTVRVHHVINFNFPSFMSDYIHRAGRTGRVGAKVTGHITSFICKGYEVALVQKIEMAARMLQSLPNVNANIARKLKGMEHQYL